MFLDLFEGLLLKQKMLSIENERLNLRLKSNYHRQLVNSYKMEANNILDFIKKTK